MGYDLLIRAPGGSGSLDEAALRSRLDAASAAGGSSVDGRWTVPNGPASFRAALWKGEDGRVGADLEVAVGGSEEEFRRYYAFAQTTAAELGGVVFDPQLSREVGAPSADEVVQRWRAMQSYMAEYGGQFEDPRAIVEIKPHPTALSPRAKLAALVIGGFLLAWWIVSKLLDSLVRGAQ